MGRTRILVADDHLFFRYGIRAMLSSVPEFEVVGEASTGAEAISKALELRPDVVLMDIQMPGLNGLEATRQIGEVCADVGVVVYTMFEEYELAFAAIRAGARGYVLKGADQYEICTVVRAVASGETYFGLKTLRNL